MRRRLTNSCILMVKNSAGDRRGPRFHIAITTYNRPEKLDLLIGQLFTEAEMNGVRIDVHLHDDGSTLPLIWNGDLDRCTIHVRGANGGKRWYWGIVDYVFRNAASRDDWDFFLMLPDDVEIGDAFFLSIIEAWRALREGDPRAVCLSVLTDDQRAGRAQWSPHMPRKVEYGEHRFWWSQWMDMAFVAERDFFEALTCRISDEPVYVLPVLPKRFDENPHSGSGVGGQITRRLITLERTMYHLRESLVLHGEHESVMHPETRLFERLTTNGA